MFKKIRGFTLVELLIVISILGILATIALVAFSSAQMRGRDTQRKSNLNEVSHALELFYADYGKYPPTDASRTTGVIYGCPYDATKSTYTPCSWGTGELRDVDANGTTKTTYMKTMPKDPSPTFSYYYRVSTDGSKYALYAHIENTQDTSIITTTYTCGGSNLCNFGIASPNASPLDSPSLSW